MFRHTTRTLSLLLSLILLLSVGGVYATWTYGTPPAPEETTIPVKLSTFQYADIYITKIEPIGSSGTMTKANHTQVEAEITSGTSFSVTFYNGSDVSYYYKEAETLSGSAEYTVSDIVQKDEIPSGTYKTVTVTFSSVGSAEIFFHFVVDKDSIGIVVARTAVDRFREILNSTEDYATLSNAMNNRSGWNKASAVTYIGNVSGSSAGDSGTIEALFGEEFMSMDLDGDGTAEPITMMIKRENLDDDLTTGTSYTYTSGRDQFTVSGVEMTLYITSESLTRESSVVVYAAVFTKYSDAEEWVELVPLTEGTAETNNYNGWGAANSFDTDTWRADSGETIEKLVTNQYA